MTPLLIAQILLTLFVFVMLLNSAAVMVYVERKVAALLQQRLGPYLVGPKGMLQPLADVIKLMFKEELRPRAADPLLFALAPMISATAAFAAFAVVPFGASTTFFGLLDAPLRLQVADVNVAILVIFAISSPWDFSSTWWRALRKRIARRLIFRRPNRNWSRAITPSTAR